MEKVNEQLERVESFQRDLGPVCPQNIETPQVSQKEVRGNSKIHKPPGLPMFSGKEPVPQNEGSLEQWVFQVEGALGTHTEEAVRSAIIGSVRGGARELLEFLGYDERISEIIRNFKERFCSGMSKFQIQKEFFVMEQKKTETVSQFASRLEHKYKLLKQEYPQKYEKEELKERVFQGMLPHLRDSMRFMYLQENVTYEEFLSAVQKAEADSADKVVSVKAKSLTIEEDGMSEIKKKVDSLTAIVKALGENKKENGQKDKVGSPKKGGNRSPRQDSGPPTTSAGPFRPGQRVIQCYTCGGWGHVWKECPSSLPGNVDWRDLSWVPAPPRKQGPSNKKTPQ